MDKMFDTNAKPDVIDNADGRVRRSHESRQKIIDASLALVAEGDLLVSAQKVAKRAGVGLRSVFRHFSDMESLFVEFNVQLTRDYQHYFIPDDDIAHRSVESRVRICVERRHEAYLLLKNFFYFTESLHFEYAILRRQYIDLVANLDRQALRYLPEIDALPDSERHHALALLSFQYWDLQHRLRGQSAAQTQTQILQLLHDIFDRQSHKTS